MKIGVATKAAARLLHEGSLAMAEIEGNGIRVDERYLTTESVKVETEILELKKELQADKLYAEWSRRHGTKTQLGSREQLGDLIFNGMGYKRRYGAAKKDRSDDFSGRRTPKNDEAAFQDVDLPFVKKFFKWQKLEKLKGTYLDGIRREMVDGRIHPFFHLHKVITYRSSSSEINFQNIPNRNAEIARRIRRAFIPDVGSALVEIDYSGAEVRSACCYNHDPRLISDFTEPGKDPHGDTGLEIFGVKKEMFKGDSEAEKAWKKGPRDWTKNRFVFPQFFGSVYFQCAPHIWEAVTKGTEMNADGFIEVTGEAAVMPKLGITVRQHLANQGIKELGDCDPKASAQPGTFVHRVKQVEDGFWNQRFHVYTAWKKAWFNTYLRDGWFRTHSGFVISGLLNRNDVLNYPVQAFAFHWLLWSTVEIIRRLKKSRMKSFMVGQIHDCCLGSVLNSELQDYIGLATEVMVKDCPIRFPQVCVPLDCEVEVCPEGTTWSDKAVWSDKGGVWGPKAA